MDTLLHATVLPAASRALLVRYRPTVWQATARDPEATKAAGLEASGSYVMKRLVDKRLVNDIVAEAKSIRRDIEAATLPWSEEGERLLPAKGLDEFRALLAALSDRYDKVVDLFVADYERAVQSQRKKLGSLYNADDYPAISDVRGRFGLRVQYLPLPTGKEFDAIELPKRVRDELRRGTAQMADAAVRAAERYYMDRLKDVADKIQDQIANQKTKLRRGSYDYMKQLVDAADTMNILENRKLTKAAGLLRESVTDVDPYALRNDARCQSKALRALDEASNLLRE